MANGNRAWNLESFLDSLIVELDKARETLAVKAINKPLTYTVKDLSLEMQLFPSFDGKKVKFVTAQPGETGASKIAIQLGSITDQQIRKTTKGPVTKDDISFEAMDDIDDDTKDSLRKIGVNSATDLEEIERKNVDIEKISNKKFSYKKLSNLLQKAKRGNLPPVIRRAAFSQQQSESSLEIDGENLAIDRDFKPVAIFNGNLAELTASTNKGLSIKINQAHLKKDNNELVMALDPYTIFKIKIENPK